eukprot:GHRR01013436.1.p1 GENE.GHRR01013436.1~~GHRR01013436.1.p1  ORF type:complete len:136 (+),score=63.76 GHRR01013436.1:206-613(+)
MTKDPDFLGLAGHNSSGSDPSTSAQDSDDSSDERSVDSAEVRAAEAEAKLRDYGEATSRKQNSALPSAFDAFDEVSGRPAFLDPEATRPLAVNVSHGLVATPAAAQQPKHQKGKVPPSQEFDISQLAPKLKGQQQ